MKKTLSCALIALALLVSAPAFALDLHQARQTGQIGEKADGYVAALKQTPEVQALVKSINDKRRQEYARISAANKQPIDIVSKLAAPQIINGLAKGEKYQDASGNWKTR